MYPAIGDVPWELLDPGDSVYIHWRSDPYHEKWVIGRSGTELAPIVVSGVKGPNGELPIVSGENATTRSALNYTNESRGLIKIGSSNIPADTLPTYIVLENLDLRSARPPFSFINDHGQQEPYSSNAASVYVEKGQNLTIRNCIIQDPAHGNYHLQEISGARDGGTVLAPELLSAHPLSRQYLSHFDSEERHDDGSLDVGAFEYYHILAGDVDNSGGIDLADVILSLQVASGVSTESVLSDADIGGDQRIGIEEAPYGLTINKDASPASPQKIY